MFYGQKEQRLRIDITYPEAEQSILTTDYIEFTLEPIGVHGSFTLGRKKVEQLINTNKTDQHKK